MEGGALRRRALLAPAAAGLTGLALAHLAGCAAFAPPPEDPAEAYRRFWEPGDVVASDAPAGGLAARPATGAPPAAGEADDGADAAAANEPRRAPSPTSPGAANLEPLRVAEDDDGVPIHGSLLLRYRGRWTDDADDQDVYATLAMDIGDPDEHAVTGHFMGRLWADVGGDDPNDIFFGLDNTFGGSLSGILYYAYLDAHGIDALEKLRVGRQQIWETPAFIVFDGARIETGELGGVTWGAYGGLRTQYYDTSTPDDLVGGLYAIASPWDGGRLRFDYMYLEDDVRLGNDQDDLLGAELRQFVGDAWTLEGKFTALEGDGRDLNLRAHYLEPETDTSLQLKYYNLLQTQKSQALEIDPYFTSLMELFPFQQVGLLASQGVSDDLTLNAGIDVRRLDDQSDIGEFNREFERYYLSTVFHDVLVQDLDLTLVGDVWDSDDQEMQTWGVDLTQQFTPKLQGSLGSHYSLYKYDLFLNRERDDVRTYYLRTRIAQTASLMFDMELNYEDDDFEQYFWVRLGARWLF